MRSVVLCWQLEKEETFLKERSKQDSLCSANPKGGHLKESPVDVGKSWFIFKLVMVNLKFFMLSFFCL